MIYPFTLYVTALFIIEYWFRPFLGNVGVYISGHPLAMTMDQLIRDNKLTNIFRLPLWVFLGAWFCSLVFLRDKNKYQKSVKYANIF